MNRSALGMVGSSSDTGRIQIARSPDRAKAHTNLSVYSSDRNNQSALTNNFMQSKNPYQQQQAKKKDSVLAQFKTQSLAHNNSQQAMTSGNRKKMGQYQ